MSNNMNVCLSTLYVSRSKRHKSGSMEEEADSPGGEYYHSPSSPASSSRNWTDEMEGNRRTRLAVFVLGGTKQAFITNLSLLIEKDYLYVLFMW